MFQVRKPQTADLPFIVNAWLKSFRDSCPAATNETYFAEQKAVVLRLLNECETLLAVDPESPHHILGFVNWDPRPSGPARLPTLHYVYVKFALRRNGLAAALLSEAGLSTVPIYVSHVTRANGLRIMGNHPGHYIFNPWAANRNEDVT
jgi:hypothetical protein